MVLSSLKVRVGQNRIYAPYMAVYLVISLPKTPYINRIYVHGIFDREMTKYTVIYGVYIQFWLTLHIRYAYNTQRIQLGDVYNHL